MPSFDVIKSVLPLVQSALQTINSFTGSDNAARNDNLITNAFDVLGKVVPLFDTFISGGEVTEDDVRVALEDYDQALADFDQEIARQEAARGGG